MKQIKLQRSKDYERLRRGDWIYMENKKPDDDEKDWLIIIDSFDKNTGILKHKVISLFDFHRPLMSFDLESSKAGEIKSMYIVVQNIRHYDFKAYLLDDKDKEEFQKKIMALNL